MIETSAIEMLTWNLEHNQLKQTELHSISDYNHLNHHHHHHHTEPHHRYHYHRLKIVSLTSTIFIQLFIATTIMASASNPSVAMNILNDQIHVHNINVRRSVEHVQSIESPKIFLNEIRPLPRVSSEKYQDMKIPFVSQSTTIKFNNVKQNQSTKYTTSPSPSSQPPPPLPLQSDTVVPCTCTNHKLKCLRMCSNEKKYVKRVHKRIATATRQKQPKLLVKSSTLIFGGSFVRNSSIIKSSQRHNHAPSPPETHENRTNPNNMHRNHNTYTTIVSIPQSAPTIAFSTNNRSVINQNLGNAYTSNRNTKMDINQMLLYLMNADESTVAMIDASTTKHHTIVTNDGKHFKRAVAKRKIRSIMPVQRDASTPNNTSNEIINGQPFDVLRTISNTLAVSSKLYNRLFYDYAI